MQVSHVAAQLSLFMQVYAMMPFTPRGKHKREAARGAGRGRAGGLAGRVQSLVYRAVTGPVKCLAAVCWGVAELYGCAACELLIRY